MRSRSGLRRAKLRTSEAAQGHATVTQRVEHPLAPEFLHELASTEVKWRESGSDPELR
jgi:hypothetical protein